MDRTIPSMNKILQKKQRQKDDEKLVNELRNIKKSQSSYNFRLKDKVKIYKRIAFTEVARNLEIRRENLIQAKKIKDMGEDHFDMKKIRLKSTQNIRSKANTNFLPINSQALSKPQKKTLTNINNYKGSIKSLNGESRKKDLLRITMENLHIRDKLVNMRSTYKASDWAEHAQKNYAYFALHCENPLVLESDFKNLYDVDEKPSMYRTTTGKFFNESRNKSTARAQEKTESKIVLPPYHVSEGIEKSVPKPKFNLVEELPDPYANVDNLVKKDTIKLLKKRQDSKSEYNNSKEQFYSPKRSENISRENKSREKQKVVKNNTKIVETKSPKNLQDKFEKIYEHSIIHRSRGFQCIIKKYENSDIEISIEDESSNELFTDKMSYESYKTEVDNFNQDLNKFLVIKINKLVFGDDEVEPWMIQSMSQTKQDVENNKNISKTKESPEKKNISEIQESTEKKNVSTVQESPEKKKVSIIQESPEKKARISSIQVSQDITYKDSFVKDDEIVETCNPIDAKEKAENMQKVETIKAEVDVLQLDQSKSNKIEEENLQESVDKTPKKDPEENLEEKSDQKNAENVRESQDKIEEQIVEQVKSNIKKNDKTYQESFGDETFEQDFTKSNNLLEEK